MTASSFDLRTSRARGFASVLALLLVAGCRTGLPPEPPGRDAADPEATIPPWTPSPDPYRTSAFEGVRLRGGAGHDHHGHNEETKP